MHRRGGRTCAGRELNTRFAAGFSLLMTYSYSHTPRRDDAGRGRAGPAAQQLMNLGRQNYAGREFQNEQFEVSATARWRV